VRLKGFRDGALAVGLALGAALIAELLGADARLVLAAGTGTALVAWLVLARLGKKQEQAQKRDEFRKLFGSKVEIREQQVILSLYVPGERWLVDARCEVRDDSGRTWNLEGVAKIPADQGVHPMRGVWRFPDPPAEPQPGHYTASMFVPDHTEAAGVEEWER
jgi:hypothetical protein